MTRLYLKLFLLIAWGISSTALSLDTESKTAIIHALQKWSEDFNAKNIEATCGLFAPDLIVSYPGTADRNYAEMCRHLTAILTDIDKRFHYEAPRIEQILIEGDLAVVRLTWILTISSHNPPKKIETLKEKGLDIFKRQRDGHWKISISYAYPE